MEPPDDILDTSKFYFDGDFDMQVMELLMRVRLTRIEVENLQWLLNDVFNVLSNIWPGCDIYPFGSIVTGLGIKTSDIDCYVQLPASKNKLMKLHKGMAVTMARRELMKYYRRFTQLSAIITAKVPKVKFVHIPTGFNCDLNFSSLSCVRNSRLISFLLNLDLRALHLSIIVKYWSKVYNFTGTFLMTNYSLIMMVIFFLQVKTILPSIAELQENEVSLKIDNWNTAFNDEYNYVTNNEEDLYQLLGDFFHYYNNFDYEQNVISPFLGAPICKQLLTDMNLLPRKYELYKANVESHICNVIRLDSSLCIQDPFEHNNNCSIGVYGLLFTKICAHFELASTMFNERPRDYFLISVLTMNPEVGSLIVDKIKPHFKIKNKVTKQYHKKLVRQWSRLHIDKWITETRRHLNGYSLSYSRLLRRFPY